MPSKRDLANRNSGTFIAYLRKKGVTIGDDCEFFKPETQFVDPSTPELITIGNNVRISLEVAILTHGFDYSVLRDLHPGEGFGSIGPVTIGDNVFIGMRSMILKNTTIGRNCIIGAGSVVRGHVPDNSVVAGNPARIVMSVDELYEKYKLRLVPEAKELARALYQKHGKAPQLKDFPEYFYLFADIEEASQAGIDVSRNLRQEETSTSTNTARPFSSFEHFLKDCDII